MAFSLVELCSDRYIYIYTPVMDGDDALRTEEMIYKGKEFDFYTPFPLAYRTK